MSQNQAIYLEFQQTISMLNQKKADMERDIVLVEQQLDNMRRELVNLDQSITLHTGGMSSVEVLTNSGYAIVKHEGDEVLALNPHQAQQQAPAQVAPSQQQYQQQPTQTSYTPPPTITPQAQQQFAPAPAPMIPMTQETQVGQVRPPQPE